MMKTLDEVIKAYQICTSNDSCVDGCPYYRNECPLYEMEKDVLHYLREYRENQLRTGIWIPVDSATVNGRCSVCGYESHLYENDVYGEHYCPNCGAWLRLT